MPSSPAQEEGLSPAQVELLAALRLLLAAHPLDLETITYDIFNLRPLDGIPLVVLIAAVERLLRWERSRPAAADEQ